MIELILEYEGLDFGLESSQISILNFEYLYAEEVVNHLRKIRTGTLYWAVGDDIIGSLSAWKNWDKLDVPVISMPVIVNLHATDIRADPKLLHPALLNFVEEKKLYE